jgi:hypothetical protein
MMAAFDGSDGDRIGDQPRFRARLDHEEPAQFTQHRHSLTRQRAKGSFGPFKP